MLQQFHCQVKEKAVDMKLHATWQLCYEKRPAINYG